VGDVLAVAVAQPATVPGDLAANVRAHRDLVRAAQATLVVFPELSLTGYALDAPPVDPDDAVLEPLIEACAAEQTTALVGAPITGGDARRIGVLRVDGGGASVAYAKLHLAGREERHCAPAVLEVGGWRVGLAVCKDTGVPEHALATAALGIDVYAAGLVHGEVERDELAVRALRVARDHGVYVAFASCAGATGGYERTAGRSAIWGRDGTLLARAGAQPGEVVAAEIRLDPDGAPRPIRGCRGAPARARSPRTAP
jgi:predicted amidohydrolase